MILNVRFIDNKKHGDAPDARSGRFTDPAEICNIELDDEGIAVVKKGPHENKETILQAAKSCPVNAIIVHDDKGKQIYPPKIKFSKTKNLTYFFLLFSRTFLNVNVDGINNPKFKFFFFLYKLMIFFSLNDVRE